MECNVINDLIPLCIDDCCSEESAALVRKHIESCPQCKAMYESMKTPMVHTYTAPEKLSRVHDWQASVLQSVLLFVSFAMVTAGVTLEAATPYGPTNGGWAAALIVPATGFLLSLANWYFIKLYRSRKIFSFSCLWTTLGIITCGYIWAVLHYGWLSGAVQTTILPFAGVGVLLSLVLCTLSKVLSDRFGKMLGKE